MAEALASALLLLLVCASLAVWISIFSRMSKRQPLLAQEPRWPVPWQVWDLLAVLLAYLLLQYGGLLAALNIAGVEIGAVANDPAPEASANLLVPALLFNALANLSIVCLATLLFCWRVRATAVDLGVRPWHGGHDVAVGMVAFVAAFAPIFAIQWVLTRFYPSQHPVAALLAKNPDPFVLLVCAFSAVLVAPLAEEFLFRVVLQGWLESVEGRWRAEQRLDTLPIVMDTAEATAAAGTPPMSLSAEPTPNLLDDGNPYRSPLVSRASQNIERQISVDQIPAGLLTPGTLPIIASSGAFALVHVGHGPDPIPLFFLALILGYLYHRTHRLLPCVVLHMCLNAFSLAVLWLSIKYGPPPV